MLSLISMLERGIEQISPSFKTKASSLMAIFPASTPALILNPASSEITGPGEKGVGPFGTIMSNGAFCPALIGDFDFDLFIELAILKGFSFVNNNAGIPPQCSSIFSIPGFLSFILSIANFRYLLLVIFMITSFLNFPLEACSCLLGMDSKLITPTIG